MKEVVAYVASCHGTSERQACFLTRQHRSTQRKPGTRDPQLEIRSRMREIAAPRIRYGYRRIHIMLRRNGWAVGRNLVWRLFPRGRLGAAQQAAAAAQDGGASGSSVRPEAPQRGLEPGLHS